MVILTITFLNTIYKQTTELTAGTLHVPTVQTSPYKRQHLIFYKTDKR